MGLVALIALEIGGVRAIYVDPSPSAGPWRRAIPNLTVTKREMLVRGALPMANILAIGVVVGLRRRANQNAVVGFAVFGALGLVLYSTWALVVFPRHNRYDDLSKLFQYHWLMPEFIGGRHALRQIATSVALVLPQLALALAGRFVVPRLAPATRPRDGMTAPGESLA
jgi:hypothetical protein